jgi:hypothetical protein
MRFTKRNVPSALIHIDGDKISTATKSRGIGRLRLASY